MTRNRVRNSITVVPFKPQDFARRIAEASDAGTAVDQVRYLARYCSWLGAKTVVIENHYIDRHYLDEFAFYYCRSLSPPPNHVQRFHVFNAAFDDSDLRRRMKEIAKGGPSIQGGAIEDAYRGFVSIRPIAAVPVGRTILARLDDGNHRDLWATGTHEVHLANLKLKVDGLAFQQQDLAVGACATAALWSALSRVTRMEHMRAPTPAEVSEAAGRHLLAGGRVVPAAGGLTVQQLCESVRSCGFAPEYVRAERNEIFVATLHAYLRSGIPAVLHLRRRDDGQEVGHAVAAVGFLTRSVADPLLDSTVGLRSARIDKLYVHDDRLGPYARAFLKAMPASAAWRESLVLRIEVDRGRQSSPIEDWAIVAAVVPVYPKIRLSVRNLLSLAEATAKPLEGSLRSVRGQRLSTEFFYSRSGEYLRGLGGAVDSNRAVAGLMEVSLPRWCGVVRWYINETPLVDFVYDSTDILRDPADDGRDLLRMVACLYQPFAPIAEQFARHYDVPRL
jgi:hypothetical protein